MIKGYSWYVELGGWGTYHNDNFFSTYWEALVDGLAHGNYFAEIGVNYCETDGLFVEVLNEVKTPTQVWWVNNHEED